MTFPPSPTTHHSFSKYQFMPNLVSFMSPFTSLLPIFFEANLKCYMIFYPSLLQHILLKGKYFKKDIATMPLSYFKKVTKFFNVIRYPLSVQSYNFLLKGTKYLFVLIRIQIRSTHFHWLFSF